MSATLNVGVIDVPHLDDRITTGDLAEILEAKYDLFRGFVEDNLEKIADEMAASLGRAVDDVLGGAPVQENPYAEAMEWINAAFRRFLDSGEAERIGMIGVPTEAALKGVNRRLKIRRGPRRESFIDSGLLRASFMAWMEFDGTSFGQSASADDRWTKERASISKDAS